MKREGAAQDPRTGPTSQRPEPQGTGAVRTGAPQPTAIRTQPPPATGRTQTRPVPVVQHPGLAASGDTQRALARAGLRGMRLRVPQPVQVVLRIVLALAILVMLGMGVLYVLVMQGPLSLAFLVGPIERAISRDMGGVTAKVQSAFLRQSEDGRGIEFRLGNLRLLGSRGEPLMEAPLASVNLSGMALLRGRIAPVSVDFIKPRLQLSYSEAGGLTLSFAGQGGAAIPSAAETPSAAPRPQPPPAARSEPARTAGETAPRIDLAKAVAEALAGSHRGDTASSYLREFGIREAVVEVEQEGRRTVWNVPGFTIDLKHHQRKAIIAGEGMIASSAGPWGLGVRLIETDDATRIRLETEVAELNPSSLGDNFADLPLLKSLDLPLAGIARFDVAGGSLMAAEARLALSAGRILLPLTGGTGLAIESGRLDLSYERSGRRLELKPSPVTIGGKSIVLSGVFAPASGGADAVPAVWRYDLKAQEAQGSSQDVQARGTIEPAKGSVRIEQLLIGSGGGQLALAGHGVYRGVQPSLRLEGKVGATSLAALLALLKPGEASGATGNALRDLAGAQIGGGRLTIDLRSVGATTDRESAPVMTIALDASDVTIPAGASGLAVKSDTARVRWSGARLDVAMPQARVALPFGRTLALKDVGIAAADLSVPGPVADVTFQVAAPAAAMAELLDVTGAMPGRSGGIDLSSIEGRAEGQFKLSLPLQENVQAADVRAEGRLKLADLRAKGAIGGLDLSGGTINVGLSDKALDAKGDILVAGVPAKLGWQRIFGAPPDKQPPLRITAQLDAADRETLGLNINHIVQGEVAVVLTLQRDAQEQPRVHLQADLGRAELMIDSMAWRKPPGRPAVVNSDVVRTKDGRTELQNFKITSDDISADGWVSLDQKNQMRAFYFPEMTVNVITRLEVQGKLREDGILDVKARGTNFDGRAFFRALFSASGTFDRPVQTSRPRPGLDLAAEIDTVVGNGDVNLKGVKLALKRRNEKLTALQGSGTLPGSALVVAELKPTPRGPRTMQITTGDAGTAMRLVGFYSNMRNGEANLEVNLDGSGHAAKTGMLVARHFSVLGDPIVSEVIQSSGSEGEKGRRTVVRERIEFDRMRVPFSIGHGQLVLGDSYIHGPLLGATMRGKLDYGKHTVFIEGTYVPLYGLNSIPNALPVIGELLGGRRGEGLFGINFSIQGTMDSPQVLVNPLSILTPGIFRQIFEVAPGGQSVVPRQEATGVPPQSSSSPAQTEEKPAAAEPAQPPRASSSGPQRVEPVRRLPARKEARDELQPDARSGQ